MLADRGLFISLQMTQASLWGAVSSTFASVPGMRRPPKHVETGRRAEEEEQDQERSGSLAAWIVTERQKMSFDKSVYRVFYLGQEVEACKSA